MCIRFYLKPSGVLLKSADHCVLWQVSPCLLAQTAVDSSVQSVKRDGFGLVQIYLCGY